MNKDEFGSFIHKILYVYEDDIFENYIACLKNRIRYISGMDENWINNNWIIMLKGLKKLGKEADHDDVRCTILDIMGELKRIEGV